MRDSHAIAPPPRMMSDLGNRFNASALSLVMKPTPFSCGNGDGAYAGACGNDECLAVILVGTRCRASWPTGRSALPSSTVSLIHKPRGGADEFEATVVQLLHAEAGKIFYHQIFPRHHFRKYIGNFSGANPPRVEWLLDTALGDAPLAGLWRSRTAHTQPANSSAAPRDHVGSGAATPREVCHLTRHGTRPGAFHRSPRPPSFVLY